MERRKNFIARNDGFTCEACGAEVSPAKGTFRNHCPHCLTSKHVDNIPGDRLNSCSGLMKAIGIEGTDPDNLDLIQECAYCGYSGRNRCAPDDNLDAMLSLSK